MFTKSLGGNAELFSEHPTERAYAFKTNLITNLSYRHVSLSKKVEGFFGPLLKNILVRCGFVNSLEDPEEMKLRKARNFGNSIKRDVFCKTRIYEFLCPANSFIKFAL